MFEVSARMAANEPDEIQAQEGCGSNVPFQWKGKEVKGEHVEQQVRDISMYETAQDDRAVLFPPQEIVGPKQASIDKPRQLVQTKQAGCDGRDQNDRRARLSNCKQRLARTLHEWKRQPGRRQS